MHISQRMFKASSKSRNIKLLVKLRYYTHTHTPFTCKQLSHSVVIVTPSRFFKMMLMIFLTPVIKVVNVKT